MTGPAAQTSTNRKQIARQIGPRNLLSRSKEMVWQAIMPTIPVHR